MTRAAMTHVAKGQIAKRQVAMSRVRPLGLLSGPVSKDTPGTSRSVLVPP
jgi:hypothetical protein